MILYYFINKTFYIILLILIEIKQINIKIKKLLSDLIVNIFYIFRFTSVSTLFTFTLDAVEKI